MTVADVGLVVLLVVASFMVVGAIAYGVVSERMEAEASAQPVKASESDVTPSERPVVHEANARMVDVMSALRYALEATPKALGDIERTLRLSPYPITNVQQGRIADLLDEHSGVVRRGAQKVREA